MKIVVYEDFNAEPQKLLVETIFDRVENMGHLDLRANVLLLCSSAMTESIKCSYLYHGKENLLGNMSISQTMYHLFIQADILMKTHMKRVYIQHDVYKV